VAIINPASLPEVEVDLSTVLQPGQKYRVVSPKDYYGAPLLTGVYDGQPVRIPTRAVTPIPPVGMPEAQLPATEPHFVAAVVLPE